MINLKDLFKCVALFVVGVIVAVFVYPILHELGHALSAIAFGVKIKDVSLFPLPSVLCEFNGQSSIVIAFIGFCGILVPSVITFLYVPNNFWFWYVWLMMKCITMLSLLQLCHNVLRKWSILWSTVISIIRTIYNEFAIYFLNEGRHYRCQDVEMVFEKEKTVDGKEDTKEEDDRTEQFNMVLFMVAHIGKSRISYLKSVLNYQIAYRLKRTTQHSVIC